MRSKHPAKKDKNFVFDDKEIREINNNLDEQYSQRFNAGKNRKYAEKLIILNGEKDKLLLAVERISELFDKNGVLPLEARANFSNFIKWLERPRREDDEDIKSDTEDLILSTRNILFDFVVTKNELNSELMTVAGVKARLEDRISEINREVNLIETKFLKSPNL